MALADNFSLLQPLREAPEESAIILDVDGTLAPIVNRPELAEVPTATKETLRELARDYLLVACVSGRSGRDARRLVGIDSIRYVGNHGLELHPDAARATRAIAAFAQGLGDRWSIEDKGLSLSLHFREAMDEQQARAELEQIAVEANDAGLDARWGRKVLEVRPRLHADKGTAVASLLATAGARRALYAGDDTTDRDAFRALESVELLSGIKIAVDSPEAPAELLSEADMVVGGPGELARHLSKLSLRRSA